MIPESVALEARAKLLWGESPEKVRAFLVSMNVGERDAQALIAALEAERAGFIRRDGLREIGIGGAIFASPFLYYFGWVPLTGWMNAKVFSAFIVAGAVGLAKLLRGLSLLCRPRRHRGDLSSGADLH